MFLIRLNRVGPGKSAGVFIRMYPMAEFKTIMDVFKLLDKNNCKKCNRPTCLAFAADVFTGKMKLSDCPGVSPEALEQYGSGGSAYKDRGEEFFKLLEDLKKEVQKVDMEEAARRVGGVYDNGRLTIRCLGKEVGLDHSGKMITDIHVNVWVAIPFYDYVIHAKDTPLSGNWVPYRELPSGKDRFRLFEQRVVKSLKRIADIHTDLFEDLVHLFNGKKVDNHYESDISLVLHPFPQLPVLICYWKPDEGMESDINVFFDQRSEEKLPISSIYTLTAGLVTMFERIALRHG